MKKLRCLLGIAAVLLAVACARPETAPTQEPGVETARPQPSPTAAYQASPAPAATLQATATPEQTPPQRAVIGAVGDIMAIYTQVNGAYDEASGEYDFTFNYTAMLELFNSVDLLCGNLETPLAGEELGYSKRVYGDGDRPRFNAPDALAESLKAVGFDVLTTANNHCLDQGAPGMRRTLDVLDSCGLLHTGVYRSPEESGQALVTEVNGIRVGVVAATENLNGRESELTGEEQAYAVDRLDEEMAAVKNAIGRCRELGAEYVIVFPHWDVALRSAPMEKTREMARQMVAWGADAVLGSHPHVVQGAEWITVEDKAGAGQRTGLAVYSMGNFIAHMYPAPKNYGMFVALTLERLPEGKVILAEAEYLPTVCVYRHDQGQHYKHTVLPALSDSSGIDPGFALRPKDVSAAEAAREYVLEIVGKDTLSVMEDLCWKN